MGGNITEVSLVHTEGSSCLTVASHACILDSASAHSSGSGNGSSAARSANSGELEQVQQPRATALCFAPPLPYFHRGCDATLLLVASTNCTLTVWDADARRAVARVAHGASVPQPLAALLTFRAGRAAPPGQVMAEPPASPSALAAAAEGAEYSLRRPPAQQGQQPQAWVAFAGWDGAGGSSVGALPWPLPEGCNQLGRWPGAHCLWGLPLCMLPSPPTLPGWWCAAAAAAGLAVAAACARPEQGRLQGRAVRAVAATAACLWLVCLHWDE